MGYSCPQVESLAALDHEEIEYEEFGKNFYEAVPAIVNMTEGDVRSISISMHLVTFVRHLAED